MLALLGISTLASLLASAVLGVRLLRLAARSRQLPEAFMGTAFLLAGVLGYVLMLVGTAGAEGMDAERAQSFFFIGYALISFGVILTYLFVWQVFRPRSSVARVLVVVAAVGVAATATPAGLPSLGKEELQAEVGGLPLMFFWLGHALRTGVGLWGTFEAGNYYLALRRRLRLGLADPIVANRILLWAFASVGGAAIFFSTAVSNAGGGSMEEVMGTGQIVLISTVTFAVAGCQWLAFLPPRRYVAWVARRAGAQPA